MAQLSARDICEARHELYQQTRTDHLASAVAPGGQTHEVDVLKLLCLSESVDYGLTSTRVVGPDEVVATKPVAEGDIVTFFPGDAVMYWPDPAGDVSMRITSDRVRDSIGEYHPRDKTYTLDLGDGFRIAGHPDFKGDTNYVGHLVRRGEPANCRIEQCHGIAVALVATKNINAGDGLRYE